MKPLFSELMERDKTVDVSPRSASVASGGIAWEEIAPPADAEDGCFKANPTHLAGHLLRSPHQTRSQRRIQGQGAAMVLIHVPVVQHKAVAEVSE